MSHAEACELNYDVVHVIESFSAGSREIVRLLANEQVARGLKVAVLHGITETTPTPVGEGFSPQVNLILLRGFSQRSVKGAFSALLEVINFRRKYAWRFTHLHSSFAGAIGRVAMLGRRGLVYTPHGCVFMHSEKAKLSLYFACQLEKILAFVSNATTIACSNSELKVLEEFLGTQKTSFVANGIESPVSELDVEQDQQCLLTDRVEVVALGRVSVEKNTEDLILLKRTCAENLHITVIGDGDAQQVERLREEGIEVTGWLSHREALTRLGSADVLVHPSVREGMPLSVLEAFAHKVLVVARDSPGNNDLVEDGVTGFLYRNSDRLIELLSELKSGELKSAAIVGNAFHVVTNSYSVDLMCSEYLEKYNDAL